MNIINEPSLKSRSLKAAEGLFTMAGWSFILYFAARIGTVFLWVFSGLRYYEYFFNRTELMHTLMLFGWMAVLATCSFAVMWGWAFYNYKRYAHLTRRRFSPEVTIDELAVLYTVSPEVVVQMQESSWSEVSRDVERRISGVKSGM